MERESLDQELVHQPLFLLHYLGDKKLAERIQQARGLCQAGDALDRNLNDVECLLRGEEDLPDLTRQTVKEDWQMRAEPIRTLRDAVTRSDAGAWARRSLPHRALDRASRWFSPLL